MQHADHCRQREEVRVRLHEHPFHFVELGHGVPALLLGRVREALRERREDRELPVRHRLELDLQGEARRRRVDLDVLRAQVPELVREDDGVVVRPARRVALGSQCDVWEGRLSELESLLGGATLTLCCSRLNLLQWDRWIVRHQCEGEVLFLLRSQWISAKERK